MLSDTARTLGITAWKKQTTQIATAAACYRIIMAGDATMFYTRDPIGDCVTMPSRYGVSRQAAEGCGNRKKSQEA
jgi:hypothetical protein